MYTALRATSRTLAKFLETKFQADPLLSGFFGGGMVVSLNTPQEMNEKPAEGLSVWLYRKSAAIVLQPFRVARRGPPGGVFGDGGGA